MISLQQLRDRARERLRRGISNRRIERRINLNAFGSRNFRERVQPQPGQHAAQQKRDFGAVENVCFFAGIEIENNVRRPIDMRYAVQKRMQLQCRHVCGPCQRAHVVDENVIDSRAAFAPWNRESFYPIGREPRRIFFVERLVVNSVRVTLQRYWPILEMRQQILRDAFVIIDNVRLGDLSRGIENLVRVSYSY